MPSPISARLLEWYQQSARKLPWRGRQDPYLIWVSEIMLQQTRVETVIPYFERWLEHFPSLSALADATEQDVLRLWEGLGYYSRARNLHRAARVVVDQYHGQIPASRVELEKLPGVGRYTAGAIASIAFGLDEPALDGNIRRVLARLFDISLPAQSSAGQKRLWELAGVHLPPGQAGDYNQALMDLGSAICTPQKPTCLLCPLAEFCQAREKGTQEMRPVLAEKTPIPHITVTAAVIQRAGQVLIAHRPRSGLLGGMWEFPGGKLEEGESLPECLRREIKEELDAEVEVGAKLGIFQHAYTHFHVTLHAYFCYLDGQEPFPLQTDDIRWVSPPDLAQFPMGKIDRQIARHLQEQTL